MKAVSLALVCVGILAGVVRGDEGTLESPSHTEAMDEYDPDDAEDLANQTAPGIPCEVCISMTPGFVVGDTDMTCGDLNSAAAELTFGSTECTAAQAEAAQFCGCEVPNTDEVCWLCGSDGDLVTSVDSFVDYLGENTTCLDALLRAATTLEPALPSCRQVQIDTAQCCGDGVDGGVQEEDKGRLQELEEKTHDFFSLEEDEDSDGGIVSTAEDVVLGILLGSVALAVLMSFILVVVIVRQSVRRY